MPTSSRLFLAVPILLLAACSSSSTYTSGTASSASSQMTVMSASAKASSSAKPVPVVKVPVSLSLSVGIQGFAFAPSSITVTKGTKVTWTNRDSMSHTVTGDNGGPSSQPLATGQSYSFTFNTAGTFAYHCSIHPSMTGMVIVTP